MSIFAGISGFNIEALKRIIANEKKAKPFNPSRTFTFSSTMSRTGNYPAIIIGLEEALCGCPLKLQDVNKRIRVTIEIEDEAAE